jgi:prepilin signal peptidase PulO-like enzyme (type II secretory pathway)
MELLISAVIGLTFGHLDALVFNRFFRDEPFGGPLYGCPACRTRLRSVVNGAPLLGYLVARGRCQTCGAGLPHRLLVLPLAGAALFVISTLVFENFGSALLGGFFAMVFLTLALTDMDRWLLPNRIVYPSLAIAVAMCWAWPDSSFEQVLAGGLVAIAISTALLLASLPFGAGAFGMGDTKMIVLIGFVVGLPSVLVAIFVGTIAAAVFGGLMIASGRRNRHDYMPHGPFLALGAIIALFWGVDIWNAYTR